MLQYHIQRVHSILNFKCVTCTIDLKFSVLREHASNHNFSEHRAVVFICIDNNAVLMNKHFSLTFFRKGIAPAELFVMKHIGESYLLKCQSCKIEFKDVALFDSHIREGHRCVNFTCQICNTDLDFSKILTHLKFAHVMKFDKAYKFESSSEPITLSDRCFYSFHLKHYRNKGVFIELELTISKYFKCFLCLAELDSLKDFEEHIVGEHNVSAFHCFVCDKGCEIRHFLDHWVQYHKYQQRIKFYGNTRFVSKLFLYYLITLGLD